MDLGLKNKIAMVGGASKGLGYAVASIDYRLAPEFKWPAQRDDLLAAIRFLRAHAAALGIDEDRLVLLGRSAGGQIATAAAYAEVFDSVLATSRP